MRGKAESGRKKAIWRQLKPYREAQKPFFEIFEVSVKLLSYIGD
jgi:hypothetical protein